MAVALYINDVGPADVGPADVGPAPVWSSCPKALGKACSSR